MTDQQKNYFEVLSGMATSDASNAEAHPGCQTSRAVAQWSIQQLENAANELPLTPEQASKARQDVKDLRLRVSALPKIKSASAA